MMEVYVVTYETRHGDGIIQVFRTKEEADRFLLKCLDSDIGEYLDENTTKAERRMIYTEHKRYGAFTGKVSKRKVNS